jgi:hypothetical protein
MALQAEEGSMTTPTAALAAAFVRVGFDLADGLTPEDGRAAVRQLLDALAAAGWHLVDRDTLAVALYAIEGSANHGVPWADAPTDAMNAHYDHADAILAAIAQTPEGEG